MARVKFENERLVDKRAVVDRMKAVCGLSTDSDLAIEMGRSRNELGNWVSNLERKLPPEFVIDFCVKYGQNINYILFGETTHQTPKTSPDPISQEFTLVPLYKARLSGGHGSLETGDQVASNLAFRTEFIRAKGNNGSMALFEVAGDSMEPFIHHGDVVMVDLSQSRFF